MAPPVTERQVKAIILRELPAIVERDRQVRDLILRLAQEQFADKRETESRFDRVLEELRRDREEQARKWDEQNRTLALAGTQVPGSGMKIRRRSMRCSRPFGTWRASTTARWVRWERGGV